MSFPKVTFYVNGVFGVVGNFELFSYALIFFTKPKTRKKEKEEEKQGEMNHFSFVKLKIQN